jgi:hypothetical protein
MITSFGLSIRVLRAVEILLNIYLQLRVVDCREYSICRNPTRKNNFLLQGQKVKTTTEKHSHLVQQIMRNQPTNSLICKYQRIWETPTSIRQPSDITLIKNLKFLDMKIKCVDFLSLENGTDRLSGNVGTELLLYAAQYPRRAHISSTSPRKPEITQVQLVEIKYQLVFRYVV